MEKVVAVSRVKTPIRVMVIRCWTRKHTGL